MRRTLSLDSSGLRSWVRLLLALAALAALAAGGRMEAAPPPLVHLYTFATPPDLSADDLVYSPAGGGRLVVVAVNPISMLYETTVRGRALSEYPGLGSFSLTRATRGPAQGHFFQAGGAPWLTVAEFDEDFNHVGNCAVKLGGAYVVPGDAVAFNHHRMTFLVSDLDANLIHEVDCRGGGTWVRSITPTGFLAPAGMTFDVSSGTYFGVLHLDSVLVQFDDLGTLVREIDLKPFGVQQPVGITLGQGKLFIADELKGELNDTTGYIYVFRVPEPVR